MSDGSRQNLTTHSSPDGVPTTNTWFTMPRPTISRVTVGLLPSWRTIAVASSTVRGAMTISSIPEVIWGVIRTTGHAEKATGLMFRKAVTRDDRSLRQPNRELCQGCCRQEFEIAVEQSLHLGEH